MKDIRFTCLHHVNLVPKHPGNPPTTVANCLLFNNASSPAQLESPVQIQLDVCNVNWLRWSWAVQTIIGRMCAVASIMWRFHADISCIILNAAFSALCLRVYIHTHQEPSPRTQWATVQKNGKSLQIETGGCQRLQDFSVFESRPALPVCPTFPAGAVWSWRTGCNLYENEQLRVQVRRRFRRNFLGHPCFNWR